MSGIVAIQCSDILEHKDFDRNPVVRAVYLLDDTEAPYSVPTTLLAEIFSTIPEQIDNALQLFVARNAVRASAHGDGQTPGYRMGINAYAELACKTPPAPFLGFDGIVQQIGRDWIAEMKSENKGT